MTNENRLIKAVLSKVEELKDDAIQLTQKLIRINSVNPSYPMINYDEVVGGEKACNEILAEYFNNIGLNYDLWEVNKGRANLAVRIRGTTSDNSLLVFGHIDTVPPWRSEDWPTKDPFSGTISDGKIYGRGAVDDKGPLVSAALAIKAIMELKIKLKGDLIFGSVIGEEMMQHELGITNTIKRGYTADSAITLEATNPPAPLSICPVQAGWIWIRIHIKGKSTHTSVRYEMIRAGGAGDKIGVSATEKALKIINALLELENEWGFMKNHPLYPPGFASIAPCTIESGPSPFVIPDYSTINYSVFYPPNFKYEEVLKEIEECILNASKLDSWLKNNPPRLEIVTHWPGYETDLKEKIINKITESYRLVLNKEPKIGGFIAVTDGVFVKMHGIPVIIFGPGNLLLAHSTSEYIEISEMITASKILAIGILKYCGYDI